MFKRYPAYLLALLLMSDPCLAQVQPLSLTIDAYVKKALEEGVRGKTNELVLESAGYERRVIYRQTDSPTLTAGQRRTRGETETNGVSTVGERDITSLTLRETTPLGTDITAVGEYGDVGSQGPVSGASGRPGLAVSASQPIYLFVKNPVLRTRRRADLAFADAKMTFASTVLSLRSQARSYYYDVMLGQESIKVEERRVQSSQKLLDVTQALVDAGKTAPVETMRAKIRLQSNQRQLHNALVSKEKSVVNAKNFLFVPQEQDVRFVTQLEFAPFQIEVQRLTEYALLHRPELEILRNSLERSKLSLEAAYEPTRPTLGLSGTYNYSEATNYLSRGWTWTATGNWMFFDSFITRDQVRSARIAEFVARLNLANGERSTLSDIRNTYLDIKRTEKQVLDFQSSREQARHNVDVLRLRFQNGLERLIDVFDAETEMRNLDSEYLNLVVDFNRAKDRMSELIGGEVDTLQ